MEVISVEHSTRLRSPVQAEAMFRKLGEARVGLRGFKTRDPAVIDRLIAAIEPDRETKVSFEAGTLDADGWGRLDELAAARPGYLEIHAGPAHLRAWPAQAKVYARLPPTGVCGVGEAIGADLVPGENQVGDCTIVIDPVAGYPLAVAATCPLADALRILRALGGAPVSRGLVMGPNAAARAVLAPFARGLGATIHVALDIAVEAACELATACPGLDHDWHAATAVVDFPAGRIRGFHPPIDDRTRERWLARIDAALDGSVGPSTT